MVLSALALLSAAAGPCKGRWLDGPCSVTCALSSQYMYEENPSMSQVYHIDSQPPGSKCPHKQGYRRYVSCDVTKLTPCFDSPDFPSQWKEEVAKVAKETKLAKMYKSELQVARKNASYYRAGLQEAKSIRNGKGGTAAKLARETKRVQERSIALQKARQQAHAALQHQQVLKQQIKDLRAQLATKTGQWKSAVLAQIKLAKQDIKLKNETIFEEKHLRASQLAADKEERKAQAREQSDEKRIEAMKRDVKAHMSVIVNQAKKTEYWKHKYQKSQKLLKGHDAVTAAVNKSLHVTEKELAGTRTKEDGLQMKLLGMSSKLAQAREKEGNERAVMEAKARHDKQAIMRLSAEVDGPKFAARREAVEEAMQGEVPAAKIHGESGREQRIEQQLASASTQMKRIQAWRKAKAASAAAAAGASEAPAPRVQQATTRHVNSRLQPSGKCPDSTTWNLSPNTHDCHATSKNRVGVGTFNKIMIKGSIEQCQDACCSKQLCGGFVFESPGCDSGGDVACGRPGICSFLVETLTLSSPFKVGGGKAGGGCLVFSRSSSR